MSYACFTLIFLLQYQEMMSLVKTDQVSYQYIYPEHVNGANSGALNTNSQIDQSKYYNISSIMQCAGNVTMAFYLFTSLSPFLYWSTFCHFMICSYD